MLAELISTSIQSLNLGARDHAALASGREEAYAAVMARDNHSCHVCGSRCFEALEVDHVGGHVAKGEMRAICQLCHNLRHPLWSGARKRIVPIFCPDIAQADLNRLAWVLIAWRDAPETPLPVSRIVDMVERRRGRFEEMMGCSTAEALFEAAMTVAEPEQLGMKRARAVLSRMDQFVRFWPAELTPEHESLDPASRISRWEVGGFRTVTERVAENIRGDIKPDIEKIRSLMSSLKEG